MEYSWEGSKRPSHGRLLTTKTLAKAFKYGSVFVGVYYCIQKRIVNRNDQEGAGMNMDKRMKEALLGGAILGLVCVAGASIRSGFSASPVFIFSLWYNRVIIGLAVGAPWNAANRSLALFRGALLGLAVSFAFYCSTNFQDHVSFVAGILYGVILEGWLSRSQKN
jgi:hypothetical protein